MIWINKKLITKLIYIYLAKVVEGMIDGLKGVYNYDSQKEALENLYSIAAFYCNINDKNDKFKDVKTNDVTLILNAMNEMLSEFGQRLKEELLDETKKIESYDQCKTMAEGIYYIINILKHTHI